MSCLSNHPPSWLHLPPLLFLILCFGHLILITVLHSSSFKKTFMYLPQGICTCFFCLKCYCPMCPYGWPNHFFQDSMQMLPSKKIFPDYKEHFLPLHSTLFPYILFYTQNSFMTSWRVYAYLFSFVIFLSSPRPHMNISLLILQELYFTAVSPGLRTLLGIWYCSECLLN